MTRTTWIIFVVICITLVGGLVWLGQRDNVDVGDVNAREIQAASEASGGIADHVFGNAESPVVLMEYGDYQCPGCGTVAPVLEQLSKKYKDKMAFVFRNFPLSSIHPNARAAAAAAEAAGLQGKFWEMHDLIYDNQDAWASLGGGERTETFKSYAKSLGLDTTKWQEDLTSTAVTEKINYDTALGQKMGVSGTPSLFMNGQAIDKYVADGKLVPSDHEGAVPVWNSAETFEKFVIIPALEKAGLLEDK